MLQSPGLPKAHRPSTAAPLSERKAFGDVFDLHKSFVRSRHWNPGIRRPPGELPRAAKRCLTPKGDEKCLATTRFTTPPLSSIRV